MKKDTPFKIDNSKIGKFLKALSPAEFIYLRHTVNLRDKIESLIKKYKLSKEDFCNRIKLPASKYNDFVTGNHDYSLREIAALECAWHELEKANITDRVIQVADKKIFKKESAVQPEPSVKPNIHTAPLNKGDVVFAIKPKSKRLTDGSAYTIEWFPVNSSMIAVKCDTGKIHTFSKDNFRLAD